MIDNKIPIDELINNAKNGVISREAYIQKTIQDIMNISLQDFVDRSQGSNESNNTITNILRKLELPEKRIKDIAFKDLIFVIFRYYHSQNTELQAKARDAIAYLAYLAINNDYHKYER